MVSVSRLVIVLVASAAVACGRSDQPEPVAEASPAASPAATSTPSPTPAPSAAPPRRLAPAVDFTRLVSLVPAVAGWTRGEPRGEQVSIGVPTSRATVRYSRGDGAVDLEIVDSTFNDVVLAPLTMFMQSTFSERSSDGYRKATSVRGQPAFEEWNEQSRRAEITVVVANRFVVRVTGHNVAGVDPLREVVEAVDFGTLAALK